jgi:hypothetical protein
MLQNIIVLDDDFWGSRYAFSRDPIQRLLSDQDKLSLSRKAQECGKENAQKLLSQYGSPGLRELAKTIGVSVEKVWGGTVHFAEYVEPDKIRIYEDFLEKLSLQAEDLPPETADLLSFAEEILITHEIFHYLEFLQKDSIFTRTYCHPLPRVLFFHPRAKLLCISEIAAMAFIKEYLYLSWPPYIFDLLFTYGFNKDAAYRLYNTIIRLSKFGIEEV